MTRVLVTAIGGGGHGDQVLKALRIAGVDKYEIYGADANPDCPQSSKVDKFINLPYSNDPNYLDDLLDACKKHNIKALFHGCEPELEVFAENKEKIVSEGIFLPINKPSLIKLCMDKIETNAKLASLGFNSPNYLRVTSVEELEKVDWFPVVVKPSKGSGGSANVFIAQNKRELQGLANYLGLGLTAQSFIIQEYVGTPENEFTVGVLHDLDGEFINTIAVKRHLKNGLSIRASVPNTTGKKELGNRLVISSGVSQGEIGQFAEVTAQCKDIAEKLGSAGPLNIQCRVVNGIVKVFEINPRFSGTTSLRALVGFNEPDILIRKHLYGEDIAPDFSYQSALILRSLTETVKPL